LPRHSKSSAAAAGEWQKLFDRENIDGGGEMAIVVETA
jgi:hypothetical protein